MKERLRVFALCVVLVAVCYANSLPNPFIQDDRIIVQSNSEIHRITPLRFLTQPYTNDSRFAPVYRPFTILSFALDYRVWHEQAFGFRITNLLLHALNGFLAFLLVESILGSRPAAGVAAALYLVHPVHTEAVVGIVGRGELLAAAGLLSAWLMFRKGRTGWAAVFFSLGLLAKENAIMFPVVAALDIALLQRPKRILLEWQRFAVLAFVAAAYLGLRFWVLGGLATPHLAQYKNGALSAVELRMTSGRAFLQYLKLLVAPVHVIGVYEFNSIPTASLTAWDAWAGLLLAAAAICFALWSARTRPVVSFAVLFFFVTLLPVSNWFIPIGALMAERFLYTPSLGVALLAGILWTSIPAKPVRGIVGAGLLLAAVLLCIGHNYIWHDNLSFYGNMVRQFPENMSGRLGYGSALLDEGRLPEAEQQFEGALRIAPMSPAFLAGVAGRISQQDPARCDQSRPLLDAAFGFQRNHWQSYWVLANCAHAKGSVDGANEFYRLAAQYAPVPNADLFFTWGLVNEKAGRYRDAIEIYHRAAAINPDDREIQQRLAALERSK